MREKQYLIDALTLNDSWKMFHIMAEFVEGFDDILCYAAVLRHPFLSNFCVRPVEYLPIE
ncbi:MAG: hypothetical protein JRI73_13400 [Deltaproteobacteria bacterium]|nr:hypothetical protein [Deltaproteobacteria bacterium]